MSHLQVPAIVATIITTVIATVGFFALIVAVFNFLLNAKIDPIKSDIVDIKGEIVSIKSDIMEIKSEVVGIKKDIIKLNERMNLFESGQKELKMDINEIKQLLKNQK